MSQTPNNIEKIKNISSLNCKALEKFIEEEYKQLIIWCNYKIRLGKTFVEFE